jgi:hypothetical protein
LPTQAALFMRIFIVIPIDPVFLLAFQLQAAVLYINGVQ